MTTAPSPSSSRPPVPPVATKAAATAQSSSWNVAAAPAPAQAPAPAPPVKITSRPPSSSRPAAKPRARHDAATLDPLSERATAALIRKTLVADAVGGAADPRASPGPIEGVLPPLTSSNEVDVQLYALVATVIKDFVNAWYTKITPDRVFVDEVVHIIAHCSRALEQRIRQVDLTELLLDELPTVVERHVEVYRTATTAEAVAQHGAKPRQIYHALHPHPALDPNLNPDEQQQSESAYRQLLIQGALAVLLPTEDLANTCLRTLVGDIIADLILGQALAARLNQPWFLHAVVSKVVDLVAARPSPPSFVRGAAVQKEDLLHRDGRRGRLDQFGLLSTTTPAPVPNSSARRQSSASAWFWQLLQAAFILYQTLRFILIGLAHAYRLPPRTPDHIHAHAAGVPQPPSPPRSAGSSVSSRATSAPENTAGRSPRPVVHFRIFSCVATILDLSVRMPWVASQLAYGQDMLTVGPGRYGTANSTLDKFLYHTISTRLLSPSLLPPLLQQIRATLFPNNTLGPPAPEPPSAEEALLIRAQAAGDILSLFPQPVARTLFAAASTTPDDETDGFLREEVADRVLGWTDDALLNKYLIYAILDHVVVRIIPEMKDKTPTELLAERGVVLGGDDAVEMHGVEKLVASP